MEDRKLSIEVICDAIDKTQILGVAAIEAKSSTLEDLDLDSLDLISLSMLFEDELKLTIDIDNLKSTSTLSDLINGLKPFQE